MSSTSLRRGFTIVELLVVIVVIGILSAITIVSYNGITRNAKITALKADLHTAAMQIALVQADTGTYPTPNLPSDVKAGSGNSFLYTSNGSTFCLTAKANQSNVPSFYISDAGVITEGACSGHAAAVDGALMQTVTSTNCPENRTRVVDARDNRTYWVQELRYGSNGVIGCWMLTNLAYAGGGTNTYGDTKTLINGTSTSASYTAPFYYVPTSGSNVTTEPTSPSTSTNGTGQYGYLYNWCGAMGAQSTAACLSSATTPSPDLLVSVCPAGWRLPTVTGANEFDSLNIVNLNSTTGNNGLLNSWLAQYSGLWMSGFSNQGTQGNYWSSSQGSASTAYILQHTSSSVSFASNSYPKNFGMAVRCVAI